MKRCVSCHAKKSDDEFPPLKIGKNKGSPGKVCSPCKEKRRSYGVEHAEELNQADKRRYEANPKRRKDYCRAYWLEHREEQIAKKRASYAANKDELNEKRRKERAANPEKFRAKARLAAKKPQRKAYSSAYNRRYREQYGPRLLAYAVNYRAQNKESLNAYDRLRAKTPKRIAQISDARHRRRARIRGAQIMETINRYEIYDRDRGICHLCKRKVSRKTFEIEHLIPVSDKQYFPAAGHTRLNVAIAHPLCNQRRGTGYLPAQLRLLP